MSERSFAKNVEISEKEFRRKFYEEQLKTYLDLSQTAAQISVLADDKEIQKKYEYFLQIYNGNLIILNTDEPKDKRITLAADNFISAFGRYKSNPADRTELQNSAKNLSAVLRNSLVYFWKIPLEELPVKN